MFRMMSLILLGATVSGCANPAFLDKLATSANPGSGQVGENLAPPKDAVTVEQFDTTTTAERAAAVATAKPTNKAIGVTIASLGNPAEPGFWLKTPLVQEPTRGHVSIGAGGKAVALELLPIDGPQSAGSRISLAAMRLLGVSLAALPELTVFTD